LHASDDMISTAGWMNIGLTVRGLVMGLCTMSAELGKPSTRKSPRNQDQPAEGILSETSDKA